VNEASKMNDSHAPAIRAHEVKPRTGSSYPDPFRKPVESRSKRALGDLFGLTNYGVNLVELPPGAWSSQRHWHTHEDEFVYVLSGELTLVTDNGEQRLTAGMAAGFPAGEANGHHLVNNGHSAAFYLEIGNRSREDAVYYPDIDLQVIRNGDGKHVFTHRDGKPYGPRSSGRTS
jgi:uncharacterized cupin superfamily protein